MASQKDYPPLSDFETSPFNSSMMIIRNIRDLTQKIENNIVIVEKYEKTFFSWKKVIDITIEKIDDFNISQRLNDENANHKICGIKIIQNKKITYCASFDLGIVMFYSEHGKDALVEDMKTYTRNIPMNLIEVISFYTDIINILKLTDKLFE